MKYICLVVMISLVLLAPGCKRRGPDPSTAKCDAALRTVPELSAYLRAHHGQAPGPSASLQGVEIALTVDWSFEDGSSPDEKEDDWCYPAKGEDNLNNFVQALKNNAIPPTVDFVVGNSGSTAAEQRWLQTGNVNGNLTYSRPRLAKSTAAAIIDDISQNDRLLEGLRPAGPQGRKYFRYPGFRTSDDPSVSKSVDAYLDQAGYYTVPATIDAKDDKFSQIYCAATARGDAACASTIVDDFQGLLEDSISRARAAALQATGREIKQIMVVETNKFTCDNLYRVLARLREQGVRFISLDQALQDPFYKGGGAEITARGAAILNRVRDEQLGNTEGN